MTKMLLPHDKYGIVARQAMSDRLEDALGRLEILRGAPATALADLAGAAALLRLGPGEPVFRQGETLARVHVILAGQVELVREAEGRETALDLLGPGGLPGFAASLLGTPPATGARTATAVRLVALPAGVLRAAAAAAPPLAGRLLDAALGETARLEAQSAALRTMSIVQRVAAFLLEKAGDTGDEPGRFVLGFEKRLLAVKLGCSQENLSRAFAALRPAGVRTRGQSVVVADRRALRSVIG